MDQSEMMTFIQNKAKELEAETIEVRAHLHEHPEVSSEEFKTSKYLKGKVKEMGLTIEGIPGGTSFTALLETGSPSKTLGIRTDIDALPIEEDPNNLAGKRKYISENPGVMHACGHDGHMAIVLAVMKIMHGMKKDLSGKVYFVFEEAGEIGAGIKPMLNIWKKKIWMRFTVII